MPYKSIERAKLESMARSWSPSALKTLAGVMTCPTAKDCDRIRAAEILLNRAWGKPVDRREVEGEGGRKLTKIVHEIVHLKPRSREEIAEAEPLLVEWHDVTKRRG
jgi:hypothetical protein